MGASFWFPSSGLGTRITAQAVRCQDSGNWKTIALHLDEGAGVVTNRADVHFVATEFGVADLHGRSIRERAKALIEIAHPKFRDQLTAEAQKVNFL